MSYKSEDFSNKILQQMISNNLTYIDISKNGSGPFWVLNKAKNDIKLKCTLDVDPKEKHKPPLSLSELLKYNNNKNNNNNTIEKKTRYKEISKPPKIIYKDKIVYRDRIIHEEKIVYIEKEKKPKPLDGVDQIAENDEEECIICYENKKRVAFQPCGHVNSCIRCAKRLKQCPLCKGHIDSKIKVFI